MEIAYTRSMRGVVITGGLPPERDIGVRVADGADLVVAADAGIRVAFELGIRPAYLVGDMDTVSIEEARRLFPEAEVRQYPPDKDETDTELALALLTRLGCTETGILGGGGGRLDHLLALLALLHRPEGPVFWHTHRDDVYVVADRLDLDLPLGAEVSVFLCGDGPARGRSSGLKWPIDGIVWSAGAHGLSNVVVGESGWIAVDAGRLLVVLPRRADRSQTAGG